MTEQQELLEALRPLLDRVRRTDSAAFRNGNMIWTDEPLTDALMLDHLAGGVARGACPIAVGGSTCRAALLDFDSHKGEVSWGVMADQALAVIFGLEAQGMHAHPFRSRGGNGIHLIMVWDEPQDAYSVRQHLRAVLTAAGLRDGAGGLVKGEVEVFPKQDHVAEGRRGSQFILPLAGKSVPLEQILDLGLDPLPREAVRDLAWVSSQDLEPVERLVAVAVSVEPSPDHAELAEALRAIPDDVLHDLDYDAWRNLIFGIHHATDGSDEGLALAVELTSRSAKCVDGFLEDRVWPYIDSGRENAVTGRTVLSFARMHGWLPASEVPSADGFVALVDDEDTQPSHVRPGYERNGRGEILDSLRNVELALLDPVECGMHFGFDEFRAEVMVREPGGWRPFTDVDNTSLRIRLEQIGFKKVAKESVRDVVDKVADRNRFDSAVAWLESLTWDGVPRIETFYPDYLGTGDDEYTRALGLYMWTALAGRCLVPGIKADIAPVWVGLQGAGKSSGIIALAPNVEFYREISFHENDADQARKMRGCLIAELSELRGLRTAELEAVKAKLTRTHENWTPKYREFNVTYGRRMLFIGTTNQDQFLADETGNRRFAPVRVGEIDVEGLGEDRDQLWAEARDMFRQHGIRFRRLEQLAQAEHRDYVIEDDWTEIIERWLETPTDLDGSTPISRGHVTTAEILMGALSMQAQYIGETHKRRVARAMTMLGYRLSIQKAKGEDGTRKSLRVWSLLRVGV